MKKVVVGFGSCGRAAGADKIYEKLESLLPVQFALEKTGCVGSCYLEPIVDIYEEDKLSRRFVHVQGEDVEEILSFLQGGEANLGLPSVEDEKAMATQVRVVLENCGIINPEKIEEYLNKEGYVGLKKALSMTEEEVIEEMKTSGLRGRGGAGFPTWFKWDAARKAKSDKKYIVCNADEGDPGAFMDRGIMEGDPHRLLEGMLICAYAVGAQEGMIYVRAEYPLAVQRLKIAMAQAEEKGYLGNRILNSDFSFRLRIKEGAGAFVCGEETALIESLEGKRGMPRLKPPFPAQKGFRQSSTNINNVETFANVPWIFRHGAEEFAKFGTESSKGTKVFALTGKIKKGGLVEVPMGTTIRQIIYEIGGGIKEDKRFKAVQMGGPSGGCLPESLLDLPIDYESIVQAGAMMGSGGMVVMDEETCMVDMARFFLDFTRKESCGKCIHCRMGTKRLLETLERITKGQGRESDLDLLKELGEEVKAGSLCGLGQTAPNPILSTMHYFYPEYEAHVKEKACPAHHCQALLQYKILDNCIGCGQCLRNCPVGAIRGERRERHFIDEEICIACGVCYEVCRFNAVEKA